MSVRLRRSLPSDLPFVALLERDAANRDFIGQWTDAEHLAAMEGDSGREHWIIEREGRPAGYLIAYDARGEGAGVYVKRLLVADKEKGTGTAALSALLDEVTGRPGVDFVWLQVRDWNVRAQAVYRKLGFTIHDAPPEEHTRLARVDAMGDGVWRMRIEASGWRSRAR